MSRFIYASAHNYPKKFRQCYLCNKDFIDGDGIDIVPTMPDDDENINKMLDGRPHVSEAVLAHTECAKTFFHHN